MVFSYLWQEALQRHFRETSYIMASIEADSDALLGQMFHRLFIPLLQYEVLFIQALHAAPADVMCIISGHRQ
jgi:hypothetical protein